MGGALLVMKGMLPHVMGNVQPSMEIVAATPKSL